MMKTKTAFVPILFKIQSGLIFPYETQENEAASRNVRNVLLHPLSFFPNPCRFHFTLVVQDIAVIGTWICLHICYESGSEPSDIV